MSAIAIERPRRKILIADDHCDTLELSCLILESEGHEVLAAQDGLEAAVLAERHTPEVIFADLRLPELDGFALCKRLREQRQFDRSVLLAVSGLSDLESVERAAEAGFDYYALKPVEAELYLNCVHAPRQELLVLLSESLQADSARLQSRGAALSASSRLARERSQALIRTWYRKKYP